MFSKIHMDFITNNGVYNKSIINQNYLCPVAISLNSLKSPLRLSSGYLNVAGLLFSKKKCPTQAKP